MEKKKISSFMMRPVLLAAEPNLGGIISSVTELTKNVVAGLIFLSFIIGLGLYVIPWFEDLAARGKAVMVRACIAQVLFSFSTLIFQWLSDFPVG